MRATSLRHLAAVLVLATPALATNPQDGIVLHASRGTTPGTVALSWTAGVGSPYTVYRSTTGAPDASAANEIVTTNLHSWTDTPPPGGTHFYRVTVKPFWTQDIASAPVHPQSSTLLANLDAAGGFGGGRMQIDFSMYVLRADATAPFRTFTPTDDFYTPDCDHVPVPVPPSGAVEGEAGYACDHDGDCHLLVWHEPTNQLYEMWRADITTSAFRGGCLAVWDLNRIYPPSGRGEQCTSADAAGLPILPLLFTADELAAGSIDHAIRFILPNARMQAGVYVRPATHAGAPSGQGMPPYGSRLRLRASYPLATLPDEGSRIIARALQRYGMILADGGTIALTAASDRFTTAQWGVVLPSGPHGLVALEVTDFDIVDTGPPIQLTYDCVRNP